MIKDKDQEVYKRHADSNYMLSLIFNSKRCIVPFFFLFGVEGEEGLNCILHHAKTPKNIIKKKKHF